MKQTYNVGYLQTPSVKHLANVKQALADNGLVSPTTPNEMLPTAIEEGMKSFVKPTGTLEITENGEYDVADKASVNVNVAGSGGGTKPTITLDFQLYKSGIVYYMVDDGSYQNVSTSETINVVGNVVTIYSPSGVEINQSYFDEDENAFVRNFSPTGLIEAVYVLYATKDVKLDIFRFDYDNM